MIHKKTKQKTIRFVFALALIIRATLLFPVSYAETLLAPHYQIEDPAFTSGGGTSSSSNYSSTDSLGGNADSSASSSNFKVQPGFISGAFPGIPGQPTLTNTGGIQYNVLDFAITTGGNPTDVTYAIAISADAFASTTYYVQADDSIGASAVWQTYTAWGSATGQRLVGLNPNTTYTIKVKARYGPDSESNYSLTAQATTVNPTLSVTIAGLNSGTSVAGTTTNVNASASGVSFGNLQTGSIKIAAQTVTVTTNATSGFSTTISQDGDLRKVNGVTIPPLSATNASPAAWPAGITDARFGYHTTNSSLCSGTANRFSADDTYAKLETTPYEVSCSTGPVTNQQTSIVFKVETEGLQPPGDYQNQISYITTAKY